MILQQKNFSDFYYKGFAEKSYWEIVIADDFEYFGGDMINSNPIIGKQHKMIFQIWLTISNLLTE